MKEFVKYDYYLQLMIIITGTLISILEVERWGLMGFYFIVGIPQLISFLIRLFFLSKKSVAYIIYGVVIIPVWISLLVLYQFNPNKDISIFFGYILIGALLYSPVMAIMYVCDCYKIYESYKTHEL
ncbi:hypothetical protein C1631_006455 [Chryseobacterium phosphatilyticum]|uniref:Uncharacterized protein n=1 Tax=Chryseobacterium phosphatilyticum TaxID=475075 RepID=A0A316XHH9_9FLAO|nr:hypothetical protein [Chryseobacterium phosphatilyticum]PWN72236.1 hypothetical protein C1631_006455 [Chryseobacterium phosphatilyticum]